MKKTFVSSSLLLAGSLLVPLVAQAATPSYVEMSDLSAARKTMATCEGTAGLGSVEWEKCVREAAQLEKFGHMDTDMHQRVTIKDKALTFSVSLPVNKAWNMGGKALHPYLADSENKRFLFGPLDILCGGQQDVVCSIDGMYGLKVSKGTLNAKISALRTELARAKKDYTFVGEELPALEYVSSGNRIVLMPSIIYNSGSAVMVYGGLLVQKRGAVITLFNTNPGWNAGIGLELWRTAASIR